MIQEIVNGFSWTVVKRILVTMMVLALTIGVQAQQYDGINTYTYDYGLSGRTMMLRATCKL